MEIRGPEMRRRLLEHGLPTDATGTRPLPARRRRGRDRLRAELVHALRPRRRARTPTSAATGSTSCLARRASRCSTTGPAKRASRTRPTSPSTSASPTASSTSPTSRRPSRRTTTSRPRSPMRGGCTWSLTNSKKPVVSGAFTEHGVPRMVEMMAALPGATGPTSSPARCRSSRSPRPATSGTARTPART